MKNIKLLEKEFIGTGEVNGFKFTQIHFTEHGYLYEVAQSNIKVHFEVFERKNVALCIDFENKIFSETEFKEIYPKSNDFGVWAWTYKDYESAIKKMNI